MAKKRTATATKHAVRQRDPDYEVGNAKPPKEHQFKLGQSGNPKGPPRHRTNLWVWFCKYMGMTDTQLKRMKRSELTAAQQTALNLVENAKAGEGSGSERMARYIVDREEGKAVEHLIIDDASELTDDECEELRKLIRQTHGHSAHQ